MKTQEHNGQGFGAMACSTFSRRFVCKKCGAKGRHSKNERGSEPICEACKWARLYDYYMK
jgi:hypothetical protein